MEKNEKEKKGKKVPLSTVSIKRKKRLARPGGKAKGVIHKKQGNRRRKKGQNRAVEGQALACQRGPKCRER